MSRSLAIDLGARRVGVAVSDEGGQLATPLEVLTVSSSEQAMNLVAKIAHEQSVVQLVVGLPLNMDDSLGPAARQAIRWGQALAQQTNLPVVFIDERLSTFAAEQTLTQRKRQGEKLTHKGKKSRLDAIAAADFLQAYLDGRLHPIDVGPITDP